MKVLNHRRRGIQDTQVLVIALCTFDQQATGEVIAEFITS